MGRRAKKDKSLGRSLQKDRHAPRARNTSTLHTVDEEMDKTLVSITEASDLSEFLSAASLADTDFTAEKQNVVVLDNCSFTRAVDATATPEQIRQQLANASALNVPRRPPWDATTTPSELDYNERESFLEWRRALVKLEENEHLVLTPFEKNLEVWRQMWRVVERSDVVVQIVDARNPLLFRCQDLEHYVKEVDAAKKNLLVVNKADLLTIEQRIAWAEYFEKEGVEYYMFSAYDEKLKLEEEEKKEKLRIRGEELYDQEGQDDLRGGERNDVNAEAEAEDGDAPQKAEKKEKEEEEEEEEKEQEEQGPKVYNGEELLDLLSAAAGTHFGHDGNLRRSVVGMVGYPNVGKSSTINVLMKQKLVAESATPGKTKHFQTLLVNDTLCLCDCPGLVFPSFMTTKAEMVCNGLLPIDQMRDHVGPISVVAQRIPRSVFHKIYNIRLPKPQLHEDPDRRAFPHELLRAYGGMRGFMASHGTVDEPRTARYLLKDYVVGKLLYCHPPPGRDPIAFNAQNKLQIENSEFEKPTTDVVEEALVDMDIAPNRTPMTKKERVQKGKRKVKRRHNGMGQDNVQVMIKGRTMANSNSKTTKAMSGVKFTRLERPYDKPTN